MTMNTQRTVGSELKVLLDDTVRVSSGQGWDNSNDVVVGLQKKYVVERHGGWGELLRDGSGGYGTVSHRESRCQLCEQLHRVLASAEERKTRDQAQLRTRLM
jgi:hypothetical protein